MELHQKVVEGWEVSAEGYSSIVNDELMNEDAKRWTRLLKENLPKSEIPLRILDVGTGPGFLAIVLSKLGHQVVGIDVTREMVYYAKQNADREGVFPLFLRMDGQELAFPQNTFDVVISRNVVWTLDQPFSAYSDWYDVLKPQGKLMVFDADYLADVRDKEMEQHIKKNREEYNALYGEPKVSYKSYEKARGFREQLPLAAKKRPEWDQEAMKRLGFQDISCKDVSESVYNEQRLKLYQYQPLFLMSGIK